MDARAAAQRVRRQQRLASLTALAPGRLPRFGRARRCWWMAAFRLRDGALLAVAQRRDRWTLKRWLISDERFKWVSITERECQLFCDHAPPSDDENA